MATITFTSDTGEQVVHELPHEDVSIGREPDNTIVIDDGSVSAHHAQIVIVNEHCTVRDLNSSNGTKVNGENVQEAELHEDDTITFGAVECVFRATPATSPNRPRPSLPHQQQKSFGSQFANLGKVAIAETKRNAHLTALKAKIEKLKLVDLNKAHYALGRKAYELRVLPERLGAQYELISGIEKVITDKRVGNSAGEGATTMQKAKSAAVCIKLRAEAEGLELQLKQRFTVLGIDIDKSVNSGDLKSEVDSLQSIKSRISELQNEREANSTNYSHQEEGKRLVRLIVTDIGSTAEHKSMILTKRFRERSLPLLLVTALVLVFGTALFFGKRRSHQQVARQIPPPAFSANTGHIPPPALSVTQSQTRRLTESEYVNALMVLSTGYAGTPQHPDPLYKQAFDSLESMVAAGEAVYPPEDIGTAEFLLALRYREGIIVKRDLNKEHALLLNSARHGNFETRKKAQATLELISTLEAIGTTNSKSREPLIKSATSCA